MWQYETAVVWKYGKEGRLHADGNPEVKVGTPPEFGGPRNKWSPEELLTASVASCLMTSSLFYLEKAGVELRSYKSNGIGTMEKTANGLAMTRISVGITLTVADAKDAQEAQKAVHSAETNCPISKALEIPVDVTVNVDV